jgi:hypothetical protein
MHATIDISYARQYGKSSIDIRPDSSGTKNAVIELAEMIGSEVTIRLTHQQLREVGLLIERYLCEIEACLSEALPQERALLEVAYTFS